MTMFETNVKTPLAAAKEDYRRAMVVEEAVVAALRRDRARGGAPALSAALEAAKTEAIKASEAAFESWQKLVREREEAKLERANARRARRGSDSSAGRGEPLPRGHGIRTRK